MTQNLFEQQGGPTFMQSSRLAKNTHTSNKQQNAIYRYSFGAALCCECVRIIFCVSSRSKKRNGCCAVSVGWIMCREREWVSQDDDIQTNRRIHNVRRKRMKRRRKEISAIDNCASMWATEERMRGRDGFTKGVVYVCVCVDGGVAVAKRTGSRYSLCEFCCWFQYRGFWLSCKKKKRARRFVVWL